MARPRKSDLANVSARIAPPTALDAPLLRLWHREFDRFPPGYFVAADVSGMILYLQTLAEYDAAVLRVARAKSKCDKREERTEVRAVRRQLIALQRALRMYPSTRAHPTTASRMANDPLQQPAPVGTPAEPAWRTIMRDASGVKPN